MFLTAGGTASPVCSPQTYCEGTIGLAQAQAQYHLDCISLTSSPMKTKILCIKDSNDRKRNQSTMIDRLSSSKLLECDHRVDDQI
ncbi:hypothetical protein P8452_07027 [Trifolium repens]|nr:hypothetical protein P8452_07027 [Trifolium repens]